MEIERVVPADMSLSQRSRSLRRFARHLMRWKRSRRGVILLAAVALIAGAWLSTPPTEETAEQSRMEMFATAGPFEAESRSIIQRLFSRFSGPEETPEETVNADSGEAVQMLFESIPFGELITTAAEKHEVDPILVLAVIEAESSFEEEARSPRGALGLMQLMPATGRWMGAGNLLDPEQNIEAGTRYLKYLESRFKGDLDRQLAAYNAGEGTVRRYGGIPPYRETRQYVTRVMENYERRTAELAQIRTARGI